MYPYHLKIVCSELHLNPDMTNVLNIVQVLTCNCYALSAIAHCRNSFSTNMMLGITWICEKIRILWSWRINRKCWNRLTICKVCRLRKNICELSKFLISLSEAWTKVLIIYINLLQWCFSLQWYFSRESLMFFHNEHVVLVQVDHASELKNLC